MTRRPKPPPERLLTVAEVAALSGASPSAVKSACADGTLPATRFGRAWAIAASAAAQWTPRPVGWAKGRKRVRP